MKSKAFVSAVLLTACVYAAPEIANYEFSQDSQTGIATVTFSLSEPSVLTMDVKTNGVSIGWRNFRDGIQGVNLGKVNPAGDYSVSWKPMDTWDTDRRFVAPGPDGLTMEFKAWSTNNTPDYMDIDLTTSSNVTYYVSEEELPYDVTNDIYKTSHILFRRIHAANKVWRMGSPANESGRPKDPGRELAHLVSLSADYYIAVFETTQRQWVEMGAGAIGACSLTNGVCPLVNKKMPSIRGYKSGLLWPETGRTVDSSSAAGKFWAKTGVKVDLPTEAQWEYACRAGAQTAYQHGKDTITAEELSEFAIWTENAPTVGDVATFAPVGTRKSNAFGLYDMIGNVSEMCVDQRVDMFDPGYAMDPCGADRVYNGNWVSGSLLYRGSSYKNGIKAWNDWAKSEYGYQRCAYRGTGYSDIRQSASQDLGFRFVAPVGDWPPMAFGDNVAVQHDFSRTVNITYDLADDSIVTLAVYTNGVKVSDEAVRCISGDVNRLVEAGDGKRISWYPDASWPGQMLAAGELSFSVEKYEQSNPPDYMALDLTHTTMTNIFWYRSAEAMPEPITNDVWKTDFLVMRRIPAKGVVWWMGIATNSTGTSVENVGYDKTYSPRHRVTFSRDFYISVFELTCRQSRVFNADESEIDNVLRWTYPLSGSMVRLRSRGSEKGNWPHTGYAMPEASRILKFRDRFGLQFDLPTEAQWEYACRAGTSTAFCDGILSYDNGNSMSIMNKYGWSAANSGGVSHPVGGKAPNAWGLYDMHGNLREYCLDALATDMGMGLTDAQLASENPVTDPFGAYDGVTSGTWRICRGGSYDDYYFECRSGGRAAEFCNHPDSSNEKNGYRLVCALPGDSFPDPVIPNEVDAQ